MSPMQRAIAFAMYGLAARDWLDGIVAEVVREHKTIEGRRLLARRRQRRDRG